MLGHLFHRLGKHIDSVPRLSNHVLQYPTRSSKHHEAILQQKEQDVQAADRALAIWGISTRSSWVSSATCPFFLGVFDNCATCLLQHFSWCFLAACPEFRTIGVGSLVAFAWHGSELLNCHQVRTLRLSLAWTYPSVGRSTKPSSASLHTWSGVNSTTLQMRVKHKEMWT